ncbi:alkaline phosphatase family protein [Candidatus Thiosymbion oneisti]|uniref:alkaline phosphatase family protein n=1 Tax=Candidatus Thiosymbion oneisti TaxID=589554 RepID=UPI000B7F4F28|nr:alkaline phosphatase family protein [Candidatus Thiosymbion oneisti]
MTQSSTTNPGRATKTLMLGVDAGDLAFIQGHEHRLPVFRRLLHAGNLRRLETTSGLLSGSVGPTFYTGLQPGAHGIYHQLQWDQKQMRSRRVSAAWLYREPFWYELARNGVRVTVVDVPMVFSSRLDQGTEVVNWGSQERLIPFHCNRPELTRDIRRCFGRHAMRAEIPVTKTHGQLARIRRDLIRGAGQKGALIRYLMAHTEWDFLLAVFGECHQGGHTLWPAANPASAAPTDALLDVYRSIDRALGAILEAVDTATTQVILFSLHGMQANTSQEHFVAPVMQRINSLYARRTLPGGPKPARQRSLMRLLRDHLPARLQHAVAQGVPVEVRDWVVNRATSAGYQWERTPAFPLRTDNNGYLRFNFKGRESAGWLQSGSPEYLGYRDWLTAGFRGLRTSDGGVPLVAELVTTAEVFPGEHSDKLPDLIVSWNQQPPATQVESATLGRFSARPDSGRSGYHRHEGFVAVQGPGQDAAEWQSVNHIKDLAPRLLDSFLGPATS